MTTRRSGRASVIDAANALWRNAASIRGVEGTEVNQFSDCVKALARVADGLKSPLAIVGGLAAVHHKARVTTLDIDIVVAREKLDEILTEVLKHGFTVKRRSPAGWHQLIFQHSQGDVEVDVIPEGARSPRDPAHAPPNPGPSELGVSEGLGYASFASWAVLKLCAGRDKDRYHLVEALKNANEGQIAQVVLKLRSLHFSYMAEFERILREAEVERRAEDW